MINLITRTNGDPFATEGNAKCARTWKGLTHTHEVIQHGGGWVLREKQSGAEQDGSAVTLQPGDYIATEGLSEDDYHTVARAFMAAGADENEYDKDDIMPDRWDLFGWNGDDGLAHWDSPNSFEGSPRQLTLTQILSATNAGNNTTEPKTEAAPMHLADQLEAALSALEKAQSEVDRLQAEYRVAYPKIHGEVVPSEDMSDPSNWRAGDVVKAIGYGADITMGREYTITGFDSDEDPVIVDDSGDEEPRYPDNFRFVRRP